MAVTWVETQVLSSVATMWLISVAYVCQSLPYLLVHKSPLPPFERGNHISASSNH